MEWGLLIVIALLVGLNVWQHWYWSNTTSRLIDKLMSRNYAEYKQVEQSIASPKKPNSYQELDPSNDQILNELNGMLGGL